MKYLLILLLCASAPASLQAAASNTVARAANQAAGVINTNDPVEKEFGQLMAADDAAQEEVDRWIRENQEFVQRKAGAPPELLKHRIQTRFAPVRKGYEDFLGRYPEHARARVAYASFLGDIGEEDGARMQLEKALAVETNNPAIYNNLAEIYAHDGPLKKSFEYYTRAIQLKPDEPLYYHNFGNVVYLFRTDAMEIYGLNEEQVYAKAFGLYSNAMRLAPRDFLLASDVAQSYYGPKPLRAEEALRAWTNAFNLARDDIEREGVQLHFARIKLHVGRFTEAQQHLNAVTNPMYDGLKARLAHNLEDQEGKARGTNAPVSVAK